MIASAQSVEYYKQTRRRPGLDNMMTCSAAKRCTVLSVGIGMIKKIEDNKKVVTSLIFFNLATNLFQPPPSLHPLSSSIQLPLLLSPMQQAQVGVGRAIGTMPTIKVLKCMKALRKRERESACCLYKPWPTVFGPLE